MKISGIFAAVLAALCAALVLCSCSGAGTPVETTDGSVSDGGSSLAVPDTTAEPDKPVRDWMPVFVDGENGNDETGDGLTPTTAVATLERAVRMLRNERNRIVITHTVRLKTSCELPEHTGTVYITSQCDGVDYIAVNGAKLHIGSLLVLGGDTVFEDCELSAYASGAVICCRFNSLTVEESVVVGSARPLSIVGGYSVPDIAKNDPTAVLAPDVSYTGDQTISIYSGVWRDFTGGNLREGKNSPVGTVDGNLTVNIGGTAEFRACNTYDDITAVAFSAAGAEFRLGSVTLNISGGSFRGPVYAISKLGGYFNSTSANGRTGTDGLLIGSPVRNTADFTINISGGSFEKTVNRIGAAQVPGQMPLHGSFTLNITGGGFAAPVTFSAAGVLGDTSAAGIPENNAGVLDFMRLDGKKTDGTRALRIACIGDSITNGSGTTTTTVDGVKYPADNFSYPARLQKLYGDSAVVGSFGYPGSIVNSTATSRYAESCCWNLVQQFDADVVIFALGTNNAALLPGGNNDFLKCYRYLINTMHDLNPNARFIMTTALYRWDEELRAANTQKYVIPLQKQLAQEYDYMELLDTYTEFLPYGNPDYYASGKIHPNNEGYRILTDIIYAYLVK